MAHPTDNADAHFQVMKDKKVDAVIIQPTLLRPGVADLALKFQLPSFSMLAAYPLTGGLMRSGTMEGGRGVCRQGVEGSAPCRFAGRAAHQI